MRTERFRERESDMERIGRKQSNYSDSKGGERWSDCQRDFRDHSSRDTTETESRISRIQTMMEMDLRI